MRSSHDYIHRVAKSDAVEKYHSKPVRVRWWKSQVVSTRPMLISVHEDLWSTIPKGKRG
jgi:hypothetical protein